MARMERMTGQGSHSENKVASGRDSRVEHATRVLLPATRREHGVAHEETRTASRFVRVQF